MNSAADLTYVTVELSFYRVGEDWQVAIVHSDPTAQTRQSPQRGSAAFHLDELRALQARPEAYGAALTRQVFADPRVKERFLRGEVAAQATGALLRICVCIDPSPPDLHALRWELLRHPENGSALATSERILFSRFMVSRDDWRPARLRAKAELRALVAVAAPQGPEFAEMGLAPVDHAGELGRARAALGGIPMDALGGPKPLTLRALEAALREGPDIVYLVAHGTYGRARGTPLLLLQDEDTGDVEAVPAEAIAACVAGLVQGPRLVVLASCQSAGDGVEPPGGRATVQATLAGRLADAGVPAIVAMQGDISMDTVAALMPTFFAELVRDGRIDRAMAVGRAAVRGRDDHWMPALYTRLLDARLWYVAGFRGGDEAAIWKKLLPAVQQGKLLPILGPGILDTLCGDSFAVARTLAEANGFPLAHHEWDDLPRVSQYLSVKDKRFNFIEDYKAQLVTEILDRHGSWLPADKLPPGRADLNPLLLTVADHLRDVRPGDVHRQLAELGASVYVTTNYDVSLERALKAKGKAPRKLSAAWLHGQPRPAPPEPAAGAATPATPAVYHVFGTFGQPDSLVLTEDDYFDYLIRTRMGEFAPPEIESALCNNALLFLGFRLTDWRFRVLFRLMRNLPGRSTLESYCHVAVQLDPELANMADVEGAKRYLKDYFRNEAQIEIFFGSAEDFLGSLSDALAKAGGGSAPPAKEVADDDNF